MAARAGVKIQKFTRIIVIIILGKFEENSIKAPGKDGGRNRD